MAHQENPYFTPQTQVDSQSLGIRHVSIATIFFVGALAGVVSFLLAITMVSPDVKSFSGRDHASFLQHDCQLCCNLALIYPPIISLWVSWIRRSIVVGGAGTFFGLAIGLAFQMACKYNFLISIFAFPFLVGGFATLLLGATRFTNHKETLRLFIRGLSTGVTIVALFAMFMFSNWVFYRDYRPNSPPNVSEYSSMMWTSGTINLAFCSGLYFMLFHCAATNKKKTSAV